MLTVPPRSVPPVAALGVALALGLASHALGESADEDWRTGPGTLVRPGGAASADGALLMPLETTFLTACPAKGRCEAGPFPASDEVAFGIVPLYQGSVTMGVRVGSSESPVFTCTVPGSCALLGSGSLKGGPFRVVGTAAPGSAGQYVVWVSYG